MIAADQTPLVPPKVLAGLVDGEDIGSHVRPAPEPPAPTSAPRPETDDEIRASIVALLAGLGRDDLIRSRLVVRELPYVALLARCQKATAEGVEPEGAPGFRTGPTPRRVSALAQLLGTLDTLGELAGLPSRKRIGVGSYLRPRATEGSGS